MNRRVIHRQIAINRGPAGKRIVASSKPSLSVPRPLRLSKLMALALHYQKLLDQGRLTSRGELAKVAQVSPARLSQIMNLLFLAPDIQEEILLLPFTTANTEPLTERDMRPIVAEPIWPYQRKMWQILKQARF